MGDAQGNAEHGWENTVLRSLWLGRERRSERGQESGMGESVLTLQSPSGLHALVRVQLHKHALSELLRGIP